VADQDGDAFRRGHIPNWILNVPRRARMAGHGARRHAVSSAVIRNANEPFSCTFGIQRGWNGSSECVDFPWLARALASMDRESQTRTVWSPEPETSRVPSGLQSTA
jgi:hypothetical protein